MNNSNKISYDARSNFGAKGWWIIIYSFISFYLYGGATNSALNTVIPMQSAKYGWDPATLLSLSTPAGLIALVVCLFFGKMVAKKGLVNTEIVVLVLAGLSVIWWGSVTTLTGYAIALIVMVCLMNTIQLIGGNMIITNWFPKKKGIAIGWATMGLNVSSATIVLILTKLADALGGIKGALIAFGCVFFVLAIVTKLFVKDYPEQMGAYPDNNPEEVRKTGTKLNTGWTNKLVLKQKETWIMGIANGLYGMITIGFVSQLIPTLLQRGIPKPEALMWMTIASLFGIVGSYTCGYLDQKFGAKKSAVFYGIFVAIGLIFFLIPNRACLIIFIFMLGFSLGGSNNYPPSMTVQIFGREGSIIAFPIIYTITGVFRSLCYVVLAASLALTGSYTGGYIAYGVFAIVAAIMFALMDLNPKQDPADLDLIVNNSAIEA
ncbi:MFS transporter [Moorella sulfitireducens]|uniref:MFS transporter n=1 Tax=Neomoorella sulfitireducens TaxID=2972948 RepID=UPI0021ABB4AC|nr:MFS transporter [Moorella sulfitireducens]